jgi:hypothetical protein
MRPPASRSLTGREVKVVGNVGRNGHRASWAIDEVDQDNARMVTRASGWIDPVWFANRWHWYFTHCGFDVKQRKIVSGEGGIDEGGVGGVPAHNLTGEQVRDMCRVIKETLSQPVLGQPSPMRGVCLFTGHPNDPKWTAGYGVSQYMDFLEF